jgi:hypothetical protein
VIVDFPLRVQPTRTTFLCLFGSSKGAYLRRFRSSISKGVQLGQVAIYCRVSTDDQSCERQERDLRAFPKRAGHHITGVFKETAVRPPALGSSPGDEQIRKGASAR